MGKTFNPFITVGSYVGVFVGYVLFTKGISAFDFVLQYLFVEFDNLLEANLVGGFITGYIAHVFIRALINSNLFKRREFSKMKEINKEIK